MSTKEHIDKVAWPGNVFLYKRERQNPSSASEHKEQEGHLFLFCCCCLFVANEGDYVFLWGVGVLPHRLSGLTSLKKACAKEMKERGKGSLLQTIKLQECRRAFTSTRILPGGGDQKISIKVLPRDGDLWHIGP